MYNGLLNPSYSTIITLITLTRFIYLPPFAFKITCSAMALGAAA